jgi:hypothetical protein
MRANSRIRVFTIVLTLACLLVPALALADGIGPSGSFFDDDGNIHEGAIQAIRYEGITRGCNPPWNTNYCPSAHVSRGQMAAFLVRALGLTDEGAGDWFTDDNDSVFERDINRLAASGITRGCNPPVNDRFCPDGSVTRGQMAAFLVRGFGYTDGGGADLFRDDDDSIFEVDIDRLGTAGVTRGCNPPTNDLFCPANRVRRDEMASFLSRALKLTSAPPELDHSTQYGKRLNLITAANDAGCFAASCEIATNMEANWDFWVSHGFSGEDWSQQTASEQAEFHKMTFNLYLNGTRLNTYETLTLDEALDVMVHRYQFQFPWWFEGTHTLVGEWLHDGSVEFRVAAEVTFIE